MRSAIIQISHTQIYYRPHAVRTNSGQTLTIRAYTVIIQVQNAQKLPQKDSKHRTLKRTEFVIHTGTPEKFSFNVTLRRIAGCMLWR